jgi:hypothetical protein
MTFCRKCGSTERNLNGKRGSTRCAACDRARHPLRHNQCIDCGAIGKGYKKRCPECRARVEQIAGNAGRHERNLCAKYGMTPADWQAMYDAQRGLCAVCHTTRSLLSVDHDHLSGKPRGLLCFQCNSGLGQFKDDLQLCLNAILYLRRTIQDDRWYISGPMTSQPNWNFDNFARKTTELRALGRVVISPHEHDLSLGFDPTVDSVLPNWYEDAMAWDIGVLLTCRGAYFLEGYEQSKGAVTEHAIAVSLGLEREYEVPPDPRHFWYSPVAAGSKRERVIPHG